MNEIPDLVVIGGGPAGIMAAYTAARRGLKVVILERNDRPGRKLLTTGNGRCNLTNNSHPRHHLEVALCNRRNLRPSLHSFTPEDTLDLFRSSGLETRQEKDNRVFPASDRSTDVLDTLIKRIEDAGVKVLQGRVKKVTQGDGAVKGVVLDGGKELGCRAVIISTGGMSYPSTGSTGDGYRLASMLGHEITTLNPALVPLIIEGIGPSNLEGLSLGGIRLSVIGEGGGKVFNQVGDLLFTRRGISGPISLLASCYMDKEMEYEVSIDLIPDSDNRMLDLRLQKGALSSPKRSIEVEIRSYFPRRLVDLILLRDQVDGGTKLSQMSRELRVKMVRSMKDLRFGSVRSGGIEEGMITRGGISMDSVDPQTMGSRLLKNLHFAGEVLDIQSITGGYNLQLAWSTGHLAGQKVLRDISS